MLTLLLPALLAAAPAKPVVTVLYFEDRTNSADLQVLKKGMAEMIITDLVAWDGVTVVERNRLDGVLGELKLQSTKAFDPGTAVKVGRLIGAQYAITGSLFLQGDQLRIDAAVVSVERGEAVASASATDSKDKVFDLEQKLVDQLVAAIDVKLKGGSARTKAKVPSFDALVAYSKAIDLSDQGKHDEASKAMSALVSKSPTFVMAREKKQALLKKLQEYEEQKKDLISGAVLEVGKRADAELAKPYGPKSLQAKATHLLWRALKGRYLLRVLKQSLSFRGRNPRVVKVGEEARALSVMQQYAENQRTYLVELQQAMRGDREPDVDLTRSELFELVRDSGLVADNRLTFNLEWDARRLADFVVQGRADDGERFDVAPPLGALDPKQQERVLDEEAKDVKRAEENLKKAKAEDRQRAEWILVQGLEQRGDRLAWLRRDEEAAQAWQRILDLLPTHDRAKYAETQIQKIIGGSHDADRDRREQAERALKGTCDDFYAGPEIDYRLRRNGLAGVEELARQLEASCAGRYGEENAWDQFYTSVARTFAQHDDCARAKRYYLKAFMWGTHGLRSFENLAKNEPWCDYRLGPETLPAKYRVGAMPQRDSYDHEIGKLDDALSELMSDELAARGVPIDRGHSGGHTEYAHLLTKWVGPELQLELELMRTEREGNTTRGRYEIVSRVVSKGGRIALDELFKPFLAEVQRADDLGPFKPAAEIAVATVVDYAAALKLHKDRKYDEAIAAFDALAAKEPSLRAPKTRSLMAQEALAKKKR